MGGVSTWIVRPEPWEDACMSNPTQNDIHVYGMECTCNAIDVLEWIHRNAWNGWNGWNA